MQNADSLAKLRQGESGVVVNISTGSHMRRRLQDIGLVNGTTVKCVQKSPLGDPIAYLIRGAVIALRAEDSSCVKIRCVEV